MRKIRLGEILREERTKQGLSLREFSAKLNISHTFLNKLERGTDPNTGRVLTPTMDTLYKIADGLNIPHKEFLEMCGYLNDVDETEPSIDSDEDPLDLEEFRTLIVSRLSNSKSVVYKGRKLSDYEVNFLANALSMSVDLVTKKNRLS